MPDFVHEDRFAGMVAGVDEAGRGPLAGPVVAAAVILDRTNCPIGLNDSKKLSAGIRARLDGEIRTSAIAYGIGACSVEEIDRLNILCASMLAMKRAVEALACECAHILVDGNRCPDWHWPSTALIGGDARSLSIAAASIVAKEARDQIMIAAAQDHPHYGWESNKGYGSAKHLAALRTHGITPLHRRSFSPVAQHTLL